MSADKLVSVIVPVYNGERYLEETLESILAQNYAPIEVIVVDDGSTDQTASIIKKYPSICYFYQENQGTAAAFNTGIPHTKGAYLAFLGADDLWTKEKTRIQMSAFAEHPGVDAVGGHVKQFLSPEFDRSEKQNLRFSEELLPGHVLPALIIKRDTFLKVGLFETNWQVGAEMSWFLRANEKGLKIKMLPDLVLLRRIHESNKGITKREFITQRAQILKIALDRRRKNQGNG